ncbi:MAG: hypothetical protein HW386_1340 [Gammaproteobacteria bacterium]|nr:hypothetical protein [Gammaproteobacteria bacterium]
MATLDELKKQASEATLRNQVITPAADSVDQEKQWHKLAPVMKYLQDHFTELAKTLNVLDKGIMLNFNINDSVTLKGLKGKNYKITYPTADKEKEFVFEFENTGEHPAYASVPQGSPAASFKDILIKNQIKHGTTAIDKTKSIKFEINPLVRTKYHFAADIEKEIISLAITNYSDLWTRTNNFKKGEITSELMDEITKHVLREPNKYDVMVGNVVSEEERTRIREKLKTQLNAQTANKEVTAPQPQQPARKEKTLFGSLFKKK